MNIKKGSKSKKNEKKKIKNHVKNALSFNIGVMNKSSNLNISNKTDKRKLIKNVLLNKFHFSQKNISKELDKLKKLKTHERSKTGLTNSIKDKLIFENLKIKFEDFKKSSKLRSKKSNPMIKRSLVSIPKTSNNGFKKNDSMDNVQNSNLINYY